MSYEALMVVLKPRFMNSTMSLIEFNISHSNIQKFGCLESEKKNENKLENDNNGNKIKMVKECKLVIYITNKGYNSKYSNYLEL